MSLEDFFLVFPCKGYEYESRSFNRTRQAYCSGNADPGQAMDKLWQWVQARNRNPHAGKENLKALLEKI